MLIRRRPDLCLPSFSPPCLRLARALPTHTLHTPHTLTNTHSYSALPPKTKQIQKKTQKGHGEGHPHPGADEPEQVTIFRFAPAPGLPKSLRL